MSTSAGKNSNKPGLRAIFWTGVVSVSPFLVLGYVLFRALKTVETALSPLAERLGVMRMLGEISLFFLLLLPLFALFLLGGWIVLRRGEGALMKKANEVAIKLVPGLEELKKRQEKILLKGDRPPRQAVLVEQQGMWRPARLVEENAEWSVLSFARDQDELEEQFEIHPKANLKLLPIDEADYKKLLHNEGSGLLAALSAHSAP